MFNYSNSSFSNIKYTSYSSMYKNPIEIKKVIFNDPATIVFWSDGLKTVVKTNNGDKFDPEKGLAMAISKRMLGNKGNYYNEFKKWLPEEKSLTNSTNDTLEMLNSFSKVMEKYLGINLSDRSNEKDAD